MNSRELSVAHQTPGECAYCDRKYQKIQAAFMREAAERLWLLDPGESYAHSSGWQAATAALEA